MSGKLDLSQQAVKADLHSVFGNNARETGQPASVWRYYLISQRPETNDSAFLWSNFIAACNNELLANLGNFCNRVSYSTRKVVRADDSGNQIRQCQARLCRARSL